MPPMHAWPPLVALIEIDLSRDCCPVPHVAEHVPQADQTVNSQFTGASGPCMQEKLSFVASMGQALPWYAPASRTEREWYFWSSSDEQVVQPLQSPILQSLLWQSASHGMVAFKDPWHGLPQALLGVATVRLRVQMPSQRGSLQSDHSPNTQSCGVQGSHSGSDGHSSMSISSPSHSFSVEAEDTGFSGFWSVTESSLFRNLMPTPQVAVQPEKPLHSAHTQ
mmetsp:Transcript_74018/g.130777  ORF Transcript_74018/g.130777 Transcript_74018/m.130777 type:complete len:222 (+) Transcript_74018:2290-2955(+)